MRLLISGVSKKTSFWNLLSGNDLNPLIPVATIVLSMLKITSGLNNCLENPGQVYKYCSVQVWIYRLAFSSLSAIMAYVC